MFECIGLASSVGTCNHGCSKGPLFFQKNLRLEKELSWKEIILQQSNIEDKYEHISILNNKLSDNSFLLTHKSPFFLSFGGDHSSAIGMWSGVSEAKKHEGDIGLIWIDAHMDSHTPETSWTGNIHGMPLAALLGFGDKRLTGVGSLRPKFKPENVALIGIRSYEPEEAEFLKKQNVRIYFMEEVRSRGLNCILNEILESFSHRTIGYGVSFDLDSIDSSEVSAVGTPVPDGIEASDMLEAVKIFGQNPPLAFEVVEYDPDMDPNLTTLKFTENLLNNLMRSYNDNLNTNSRLLSKI